MASASRISGGICNIMRGLFQRLVRDVILVRIASGRNYSENRTLTATPIHIYQPSDLNLPLHTMTHGNPPTIPHTKRPACNPSENGKPLEMRT